MLMIDESSIQTTHSNEDTPVKAIHKPIKPVAESRQVFASPWLALLVVVRNGWRRDERPKSPAAKSEMPVKEQG